MNTAADNDYESDVDSLAERNFYFGRDKQYLQQHFQVLAEETGGDANELRELYDRRLFTSMETQEKKANRIMGKVTGDGPGDDDDGKHSPIVMRYHQPGDGRGEKCFRCNKIGHQARDCLEGIECFSCGGNHMRKDCVLLPKHSRHNNGDDSNNYYRNNNSNNNNNYGNKTRLACYNCGSGLHIARDCKVKTMDEMLKSYHGSASKTNSNRRRDDQHLYGSGKEKKRRKDLDDPDVGDDDDGGGGGGGGGADVVGDSLKKRHRIDNNNVHTQRERDAGKSGHAKEDSVRTEKKKKTTKKMREY